MSMASGKGVRFSITASDKTRSAFNGVQNNLRKTQGVQRSWNKGLSENRRAVQQLGFQMTDFGIQIAGGQNAMLAFTQQGGQMLQVFGPAGAIMATFLTVFGTLSIVLGKTGKSLADMTPIMGVLADDFQAIGRVMVSVKELMLDFANVVVNNLDRILITAATVAGFFAARWVRAFIAARIATFTLVGALYALRTALIRIGIGALIVGAGELVYQFTRLVKSAGGFGNAMSLLGAVIADVWSRAGEYASVMAGRIGNAWQLIKGHAYTTLQGILDNVEWMANKVIGAFVGAYRAIVAVWGQLPAAFRRAAGLAVNALIEVLQTGIAGVTGMLNNLFSAVGLAAIPAPDLSAWKAEIGEVVDVAGAAKDAFADAFNGTYTGNGTAGGALGTLGDDLIRGAGLRSKELDILADKLGRPLKSIKDLREAMGKLDEEGSKIDVRDWFKGGADDDASGGSGGGGGGGKSIADKLSDEAKRIKKTFEDMTKTISSALGSAFKGLVDGTKSLGEAASDVFVSILDKMTEIMMQPVWDTIAQGASSWLLGSGGSGGVLSGIGGFVSSLVGRSSAPTATTARTSLTSRTSGLSGTSTGASEKPVQVHIHENARSNTNEVKQSPGRVDVFLRKALSDVVGEGGLDKALRDRYAMRPVAQGG